MPELKKQLKKWEDTEKAYVGLFPWLSDASGVKNKINNCFSICNAESGLDREPGWKKGSYFVIVD